MKLQDQVSIVTGAGSGMGRAASVLFAKEGSKVVLADIDAVRGQETARFVEDLGGDALFVKTDVSKTADVKNLVKQAVAKYGKVTVLYNNVGYMDEYDDTVTEMPEEVWDRIMAVNLRGMYLVAKYTIPEMAKTGGGKIVNIASVGGLIAMDSTGYAVSKAGVISLTKCIAQQYAKQHIRCNVICPGPVDTPFNINTQKKKARSPGTGFTGTTPLLERRAKPEEIAKMGLFLASDDSSYATGATFIVDGGRMAR